MRKMTARSLGWKLGKVKAQTKTHVNRVKRANRLLTGIGFTPYIAGILAGILCELIEGDDFRRNEVLNLFSRIARGE